MNFVNALGLIGVCPIGIKTSYAERIHVLGEIPVKRTL